MMSDQKKLVVFQSGIGCLSIGREWSCYPFDGGFDAYERRFDLDASEQHAAKITSLGRTQRRTRDYLLIVVWCGIM